METRSQNPVPDSMQANNCLNPTDPASLDSTDRTRNENGGDWQEEAYQKIKAMKDLYLHDLNDMHQKLLGKLQHQPTSEQLEKLKVFKNMLERFIPFLQIPKQNILPSYKDKLGTYEKQIVNVINSNRRKPEAPQQHKSSLDSTDRTRNANGGDWQEKAYQKINAMKDVYLHDLNYMHQKILGKMQHHDSLPKQPKNEELEKLKVFKNMLERFMAFLQIPKQSILANHKDKLGTYEKQIVHIINSNKRKPGAPQQHKSSFDSTDHTRSANGGDWQEEVYQKNRLHLERGLTRKYSNIVLKKETDEHSYCQPKKQRTGVSEVLEGINVVEATNNKKMGHGRVKSITLTSNINEGHSLDNARTELPDLNVPYTVQTASLPTQIKVESDSITHGSMLENAILEMETMVADSRRVHGDIQDVDHPVATKSRLPCELKQKLEIVARLAHSSQGRISDEIILRLTSILGHWLKPRALKRCLRDMVPSDLSACGGDAARFIQFKKEVMEMIKLRNPSMATKDVSNSETLGLHAPFKAKYSMDNEMEDKICDFYDIYVQGMNQIKSSEIRKFYIQLAALWPKGTMDNHGIRNAICRSKERQRTAFQEKGHEKGKQKSSNARMDEEDLHGEAKLLSDTERSLNDANTSNLAFLDSVVPGTPELDQNLSAPAKRFSPPSASSCHDLLKQGKFNIF